PSANPEVSKPGWSNDGGVVMLALLPLMIMAFIVTALPVWFKINQSSFDFFPFNDPFYRIVLLGGLPAIDYLLIKLGVLAYKLIAARKAERLGKLREDPKTFSMRYNILIALSALFASGIAGVLLWFVSRAFLRADLFTAAFAE